MKTKINLLLTFFFLSYLLTIGQTPPVPEKIKKEIINNGNKRIDNYYWMNDQGKPKLLEYIKAENEYLKNILKPTENLQEKLYQEINGRNEQNETSVPYKDNGYYYYYRYEQGKQYKVYLRKKDAENAEEEILLDVNELSAGHEYFLIHNMGLRVSPDNKLLAFCFQTNSSSDGTIKFKNLLTGQWLKEEIPGTNDYPPVWANDGKTIFYTLPNKNSNSQIVKKHLIGENPKKDKVVFHEKDAAFDVYCFKSKSNRYIFVRSESTEEDEYLLINADSTSANFKIFQPREKGLKYSIEHDGDQFYILTNYLAKNFRVMATHKNNSEKENWSEVVPQKKDAYIVGMDIFKNYIALNEIKDGLSQISIIDLKNKTNYYIKQEEDAYSTYIQQGYHSYNYEINTELLIYSYSSLTTPHSVLEHNMRTGESKILMKKKVSEEYDQSAYESKRIYATAKDGKKIPISLVYKKGLVLNGNNPLLVTSYGACCGAEDLSFSSDLISLLDRGFVYAHAHVRGGEDLGREWFEDGSGLNKKNTFTDFIACAEELIKEKYTNSQKLFAQGGSAGGLLMGVIINMQPELFKGVIANVPPMDILSDLLAFPYFDDYGDPNKKDYYDYIRSYSPYDNIESKKYPAILLTTGIEDYYWVGAKYTAKLRELKTDNNSVLLYTNMYAGHYGASGRYNQIKETALQYAFLLQQLGINE